MNGFADPYGTLLDLVHRLEDASRAYGARPLDVATCDRLRDEEQRAQTELLRWVQGRITGSDEGLRRAAETVVSLLDEDAVADWWAPEMRAAAKALRFALSGAKEG
jgi:hypothetical protein